MIKMIKSYNAYTSKLIVFLAYVLFPVFIIFVFSVLTFSIRTNNSQEFNIVITVLTAVVMAYLIVANCLADRFSMSGEGIKTILKRRGIYKSADQPVFIKKTTARQATIPFVAGTVKPEVKL